VCAALFKALLVVLVAAAVGLLAYRLWRWHVNRPPAESPGLDSPAAVKPDLEDEAVAADALPEDRWTQLAREQAAAGNLRLALRALYLGTLAHLGQRQLIVIARAKSNREYQRELERRAHALPQVLEGFAHNVGIFENVWYGLYPVDEPLVQRFQANVERIRGSETSRSA
jgi:hypothetical protein